MLVVIYESVKSTMQSGPSSLVWKLRYEDVENHQEQRIATTNLLFSSKCEAIRYVENKKYSYVIENPHHRKLIKKSYADNFLS